MNSEERRLLTDFLGQLQQVKGVAKDPDAARLIAEAASRQPEAIYLLVQKALLQEQALKAAQGQIAELASRLEQYPSRPASRGGFLGPNPWGSPRPAPVQPTPWPALSAGQQQGGPGSWGSFLGTAAATAAGVAGGAFLFQGLESLLGHHGSGGGGFFDTADVSREPVENITINEYYGNDDRSPDADFRDATFDSMDDSFDAYDDDNDTLSV